MNSISNNPSLKVAFLIAGVQKGGTTTLDYYLRQHPEVCMANRKEVHFFDNEKLFADNKPPDYNFYHSSFQPENTQQLIGESTPIYSYWRPSAKRIFDYNPQMKFILLLRNPIARAYSHWNKETINFHSYADQKEAVETLSFYDAILTEEQRCKSAAPLQHRYYSYIDRGFYTQQLNRLLRFFPRQQLLILKSEWLWNSPEQTLDEVYSFLGISPQALPAIKQSNHSNNSPQNSSPVDSPDNNPVNIGIYKRPIEPKEKNYLIREFKEEINKLEKMLDWDCSDWLK